MLGAADWIGIVLLLIVGSLVMVASIQAGRKRDHLNPSPGFARWRGEDQ